MGFSQQRAVLVGLSAAAAAFGVATAVAMSTAAPAHADDTSTIFADVSAIEAEAATAFSTASTDFADGDVADGLTQLFSGLDDDLFGVPNFLDVALTDEFQGVAVIPASDFEFTSTTPFDFATPTSVAESITEAQSVYALGTGLITTITSLPTTDYADTALDNALSTIDQYVLPEQIELIANLAYAL